MFCRDGISGEFTFSGGDSSEISGEIAVPVEVSGELTVPDEVSGETSGVSRVFGETSGVSRVFGETSGFSGEVDEISRDPDKDSREHTVPDEVSGETSGVEQEHTLEPITRDSFVLEYAGVIISNAEHMRVQVRFRLFHHRHSSVFLPRAAIFVP